MRPQVLVVEDEEVLAALLEYNFEHEGFSVTVARDGDEALLALREDPPDLAVLDWMLPGPSGIEICRQIRAMPDLASMPVIMLTARGEEADRIRGLNVGADDYLGKPFSLRELEARVKAVLRRAQVNDAPSAIAAGGLEIDTERHQVRAHGEALKIGPTEFRLLYFLMSNPERVFSRTQLLDNAWGRDVYIEERTVDVHVRRLRKRLEAHGMDAYVQTVRGVGYRFAAA